MANVTEREVIIIGAGLTGLTLGRCLQNKNKAFVVLEKSAGLGGRVATRRVDELGLDHGAAFLNSSPLMLSHLRATNLDFQQHAQGIIIEGGMNRLPKALAQNLPILKNQKVEKITRKSKLWELETETGELFQCQKLVLTAPAPQALELLSKNKLLSESSEQLHELTYTKALVFIMSLEEIPMDLRSFEFEDHEFLFMRERHLHPRGVIIDVSPTLSEKMFEEDEELIKQELLKIYARSPLNACRVKSVQLKKWRYSRPMAQFPAAYIEVAPSLFLAGDSFGSPCISAHSLARDL